MSIKRKDQKDQNFLKISSENYENLDSCATN